MGLRMLMGTIQTVKDVSGYNSILFRILVVTIQTFKDVFGYNTQAVGC